MKSNFKKGSQKSFDLSWKTRKEAQYIHWSKNESKNQIQLAFKSHFNYFSEIHGGFDEYLFQPKFLEVGCGRGSLGAYYSQTGWSCDLVDTSEKAINVAKKIFKKNELKAEFKVGDAENLPYKENIYDVVASIGLLEHFDDPAKVIEEKIRVTKKGGWIINYIVPKKNADVQNYFKPFNFLLSLLLNKKRKNNLKDPVYRTSYKIEDYKKYIPFEKIDRLITSGTYPIPMISPSPDFPFTLCPRYIEKINVKLMNLYLNIRRLIYKKNPWSCEEQTGHAILIAFRKK